MIVVTFVAAIAELLDNAVDEVCVRSEMLILGSFLMIFVVFATVFGYFELLCFSDTKWCYVCED